MKYWLAFMLYFICGVATADVSPEVQALQTGWSKANYQLKDDAQETAFLSLIEQAKALTKAEPTSAEAWIWQGIIQSTFAGIAGPFDAMDYAEAAKAAFEQAMQIDDQALQGSAYTSLGTLYFKVPGWPIGFGDDDKAKELLEKAVQLNPAGIDSHYFYADFLYEQDEYVDAKKHLLLAQAAAPRPNRPIADTGRQADIKQLLAKVTEELD